MRLSAALLAAVALVPAGSPTASRVLWQGPVFAGDSVVWGEESGGKGSLHLWSRARDRVVYGSDSLALGRPLAASRRLLAFERTYPSCPPRPNVVCPQATDAVVGPLKGPFHRLMRPRVCFLPTSGTTLALDGGVAAYLEIDCTQQRLRVLVRDIARRGGPLVLREAALSGGCCRDVAIAGRRVAWIDGRDVVVRDRLSRATSRTRIGPEGIDVDLGFDLQSDGKLAFSYRLVEVGRVGPTTVAWSAPSKPGLHELGLRGGSTTVKIAGDRIAFERYLTAKTSALVVSDLAGRARAIARFAPPTRLRDGFDFDGRRITWASDRVISTRTDCPPPGQGRPCVQRETGVTTIWRRDLRVGRNRTVVRLPFVDTIAHP
jgi:hypothetical protein